MVQGHLDDLADPILVYFVHAESLDVVLLKSTLLADIYIAKTDVDQSLRL